MPNFFSYPTPIITFVVFFHFCQPCCLEGLFRCLFGATAAVGTPLCRVAMLVSAVFLAYCDHEALMLGPWPPRGSILQLRGLHVATVAFTSDVGIIFCWFSFIFATQWRLEELFR